MEVPLRLRPPQFSHFHTSPDSVQFSCSVFSDSATPWTAACQASRPSPTPEVYSDSCPLSWWFHPTISSSVIPFSSCLQSFPASGSFQMSHLFSSDGQDIGVSATTSVFPMDIQDWFSFEWTGWISLQSKGLPRVFSNTIVQKCQFLVLQTSPDSAFSKLSKLVFQYFHHLSYFSSCFSREADLSCESLYSPDTPDFGVTVW